MLLNVQPDVLSLKSEPGSLTFRHPEYERRRWWREFNRISYLGGRDYLEPTMISTAFRYPDVATADPGSPAPSLASDQTQLYRSMLYRHNREKSFEFANRHKRAYYQNIVRSIVNLLVSHSMKRPVERKGDDLTVKLWGAVDRERHRSMDSFVRYGQRWASVEGIMWACVDNSDGADGYEAGPYGYWVNPLDVFDWEVDDAGKIVWLKQFVYSEKARTWRDPVTPVYRYRIWKRDGVETYETDVRGSGATEVPALSKAYDVGGVVPWVPLYSIRNEEYTFPDATPLAADLCKGANHVFNISSLLSEILYKQTFSWLAIPDKNIDKLQVGTSTAFGYDPSMTSAVPTYVSPDADQARVLMESVGNSLEQIRQSIGVGRGRSESSKQQASGDALELESEDKKSILGDLADEAEDFERRFVAVANGYRTGAVTEQPTIRYSREFDVQGMQDDIDEVLSFKQVGVSPEISLEMVSQLVRRRFAGMDPKELDALLETLKAMKPAGNVDTPGGDGTLGSMQGDENSGESQNGSLPNRPGAGRPNMQAKKSMAGQQAP